MKEMRQDHVIGEKKKKVTFDLSSESPAKTNHTKPRGKKECLRLKEVARKALDSWGQSGQMRGQARTR